MDIFKNKGLIRLFAFITACLIIICLLAFGIDVHASNSISIADLYGFNVNTLGITSCWNKSDFSNSSLNDSDRDLVISSLNMEASPNYTGQLIYFDGDTSNGEYTLPETFTWDGDTYNISDFPYFVFRYNQTNSQYRLQVVQDISKIVGNNGNYVTTDQNYYNNYVGFTFQLFPDQVGNCIGKVGHSDTFSSQGIYSPIYTTSGYIFSNFPMYTVDLNGVTDATETIKGNISNGYIEYWLALSGAQNYGNYADIKSENINYLLTDGNNGQGYTNPITNENYNSSDDNIEGDATNYMYFKDYNISYSVSGLYSGNVVCYGTLNDYQKEHLDEFALTYTFTFEYKGYQPRVSGNTYNFTKVYSYQQTLADFYDNSSSKTFTLKEIMQNINTQDIHSEYGNLYQLIYYFSNLRVNQDSELDDIYPKNNEFVWQKARMKTTVFIVSANDSPSDILNSSDLHSNSFSKAYNFLDGSSSTYSDGITSNNNPYQTNESGTIENQQQLDNMENGVASSDIPSSQGDNGGSGTSVVTGDNNIVINNNPTFTNNGGSGSGGGSSDGGVASTFYNTFNPFKTLFSSLNGDNNVISDDTAESIGANRFISVMSSTFSFIPEGMWTALTTFFIASLSILVVAVVIRVLLDLL